VSATHRAESHSQFVQDLLAFVIENAKSNKNTQHLKPANSGASSSVVNLFSRGMWELIAAGQGEAEKIAVMLRRVTYWITTGILAALSAFAGFAYVSGNQQAVTGFAHLGYPQHLRIVLGIAKLLGAITLLIPGFPTLKEWAYAGFSIAWISAFVAHYVAKDGLEAFMPLILLILLFVSYVFRPAIQQTTDTARNEGR
jgi:uncharacterized membrane protein YphA (DoxX/SURF4 family)